MIGARGGHGCGTRRPPRGAPQAGKALADTAAREAREGTGLDVAVGQAALVTEYRSERCGSCLQVCVESDLVGRAPAVVTRTDPDVEAVRFVPPFALGRHFAQRRVRAQSELDRRVEAFARHAGRTPFCNCEARCDHRERFILRAERESGIRLYLHRSGDGARALDAEAPAGPQAPAGGGRQGRWPDRGVRARRIPSADGTPRGGQPSAHGPFQ